MRYDDELQSYLKSQGLRSLKSKTKKKPEPKPPSVAPVPQIARREPSIAQPPPAHSTPAATQQQQLAQAFMGLPIAGGLPMAVGMSPGMMGMLPHFSQVNARCRHCHRLAMAKLQYRDCHFHAEIRYFRKKISAL